MFCFLSEANEISENNINNELKLVNIEKNLYCLLEISNEEINSNTMKSKIYGKLIDTEINIINDNIKNNELKN